LKYFVFVMGPYDSIFVGPFDSKEAADAHAVNIIDPNKDAYVMSDVDMKKNIMNFGEIHVEAP